MGSGDTGQATFRPRARLLLILGEQLIATEVVAVVELVKNAYDADATIAQVSLDNISDKSSGQIVVEDDGLGMSLDIVLHAWLEPATDYRDSQKREGKRTAELKRLPLGEKGVGRFAAHKLGDIVELVTRAKGSSSEIHLVVDWTQFGQGRYLDEVPIMWEVREPIVFVNDRHGTRVTVMTLRKAWTESMVVKLAQHLQELTSPFARAMEFRVAVSAPGFEQKLNEVPDVESLLDTAFYSFSGQVSADGILSYTYTFHHPLDDSFRRESSRKLDIRDPKRFSFLLPQCGPFHCQFYVWDRDRLVTRALREKSPAAADALEHVLHHTGIRVYRDDFRVWPYGEPGDDWLRLDIHRLQLPQQRLSNNQIVGFVEISHKDNPDLRDKTNREGLIEDDAFQSFVELIRGAIQALEAERRSDKDRVYQWITQDAASSSVIRGDKVEDGLNHLQRKVRSLGDGDKYGQDIERLQAVYREAIETIVDPLLVAAGLGVSYMIPVHEIRRNVFDLHSSIDAIIRGQDLLGAMDQLNASLRVLDQLDHMVSGVGRVMRKSKQEQVHLNSVVTDAIDIVRLRLDRENIKFTVSAPDQITIRGQHNLLVTATLNLLDNAAYWLQRRESDRKITIRVCRLESGEPSIIVSDNGPGILDDPALLLKPFFTRKSDGSGLGLYIVNQIMIGHHGRVVFMKEDTGRNEESLPGATVALVFRDESEASV